MEFQQQQAIYLQIADFICEKILQKKWCQGDRISSVREMAVDIEVNPNTVVRTYGYLEAQSIIFKQRGIGYFVADDAYDKILALKKKVFLTQDLPKLLKTMQLLQLDFDELIKLGAKHEKE